MIQLNTKKITALLIILLFCFIGTGLYIYQYTRDKTVLFGGSSDPFPPKRLNHECCRTVNTHGLSDLNTYGSGFIYYSDFKKYFANPSKIHMISLMDDDIYYYKESCLVSYGLGYTLENLGIPIITEKAFKAKLSRLLCGPPIPHELSQFQTERQIIEEMGGHYYLPLKGNEEWLSNQGFMEDLIHYFESLPTDALLYVHCIHGRGRTTTILVLYDIFRNAKQVPLKDLTNRHFCLGRENVLNTEFKSNGTWSQEGLNARKDLVARFYDYMTDQDGYKHQSWTQWNLERGTHIPQIIIHR